MIRKPYIMKMEEMQTLIASLVTKGAEETYARMRAKAFMAMDKTADIDEMFLDMSETFLKKGRSELESSDEEDEEVEDDGRPTLISIYYTVAFLLRRLAHEVYRRYIKMGKQRDNDRFIRLVSYDEEAPLLMI